MPRLVTKAGIAIAVLGSLPRRHGYGRIRPPGG